VSTWLAFESSVQAVHHCVGVGIRVEGIGLAGIDHAVDVRILREVAKSIAVAVGQHLDPIEIAQHVAGMHAGAALDRQVRPQGCITEGRVRHSRLRHAVDHEPVLRSRLDQPQVDLDPEIRRRDGCGDHRFNTPRP
jgi:hypothetical protein